VFAKIEIRPSLLLSWSQCLTVLCDQTIVHSRVLLATADALAAKIAAPGRLETWNISVMVNKFASVMEALNTW
jgi:hypothetical protein